MSQPERILIADDDEYLQHAVTRQLSDAGYASVAVSDGQAALSAFQLQEFDVALLDLDMPGVDGFGVLEALQGNAEGPVPIVLTGTGDVRSAVRALKLGAFDFLEKPCNPELLANAVSRAIGYKEAQTHARRMEAVAHQWQATFDASPDVVVVTDLDGCITRCNRAAGALARQHSDGLIGRNIHEALCGDLHPAGECPLFALHDQDGPQSGEHEIAGGWYEISCKSLKSGTGELWGRMLVARNVTRRRSARIELMESENKLSIITGVAQDAILMMTPDGRISFYNKSAAAMFGWAAEEAMGKNLHDLLAPEEYRGAYRKGIEGFRKTGRGAAVGQCIELAALRKDGSTFPVEVALSGVNLQGQWHAVGLVRDITERKQAERAILESETRYRALFESSRDAIMTSEPPSWRFTSGNPECLRMFRVEDMNAFLALGPWDLSPEQQPDGYPSARRAKEMIEAAMREGSRWLEWRHRRLDGEEFDATVLLTRVEIGDKAFVQATVRDATSRKRMENQLRASEEKFRQIVDNIGLGVALVAPDLRIIDINSQMQKWFPEVEPEKRPVCHVALNSPPRDEPCPYCPTLQTFQDGRVHEMTIAIDQCGDTRKYRIVSSPIHGSDGNVATVIEMVEDVTERLRLEQELNQAQKLEAVGRLAAGIAHEINTPTQYVGDNIEFLLIAYESILGLVAASRKIVDSATENSLSPADVSDAAELIESSSLDYLTEQIPKAISQSLEGVNRISSIVQAMKEFSHPGTTEKTAVSLNQCIMSTVTVSRNEWKYVAELETELDESLPLVSCLPGEFNQVILNMIVNAAHAIGDVVGDDGAQKGTITISTCHNGTWAEVRIADTGGGIPDDIRQRIFDPFYTTKGVGRGTGQGLPIARNVIVDKHGGSISVESEAGKGAVFTIKLPINPAELSASIDDSEVDAG